MAAVDATPLARAEATQLVEDWIRRFHEKDSKLSIKHVEMGFTIWLDDDTLIIGVQDMIAEDEKGILGNEWKTSKAPTKFWGEGKWLEEISRGPQIAIYALAQSRGIFYERGREAFHLNVERPRIRVRAAVKSFPSSFWPTTASGIYSFTPEKLETVQAALMIKAKSIRAARSTAFVPWQLTGRHCIEFNKECQFLDQCRKGQHPMTPAVTIFDPSDPASTHALSQIEPERLQNPNLVVLSASSYDTASVCMEKYRLISGSFGAKKPDLARDTGTVFHAGVAEYYRQLRG